MKKKIVLSHVGRNLNRAYRTAEAFGIQEILLHNCTGIVSGNLFKSKGRVEIKEINGISDLSNAVYFETDGDINIEDFDFTNIEHLVFGGETRSIPKSIEGIRIKIPTIGMISGLTVEAAIAITLHEINRSAIEYKRFRFVDKNLICSSLPNGKLLSTIKEKYKLNTVIDLSDRPRKTVSNWCIKNRVEYIKIPIDEMSPVLSDYNKALDSIKETTLVHCYKGLHRTGVLEAMYRKRNKLAPMSKSYLDNYYNHIELKKMYENIQHTANKMVAR